MQAGTGKTTALCFFAMCARYCLWGGKLYGSGPTNTAVSNFANRLYRRSSAVVLKANEAKKEGGRRHRRLLVVRGHHFELEVKAFNKILEKGVADNSVVPPRRAGDPPRWRLPLSPANWILAIFRSTALERTSVPEAVKCLHADDAQFLLDMQETIEQVAKSPGPLQRLVKLARGEMSFAEYSSGDMVPKSFIIDLMQELVDGADTVMTTPAGAQKKWYKKAWESAAAIFVDEAACMTKADLCSIWGNTLRPLGCAGDGKQLPPTIMELLNMIGKDALNRLGVLGQISALTHLQAGGLPVHRLTQQLRMAKDMFGMPLRLFYPDLQDSFSYGDGTDPSAPQHSIGRAFEEYLLERDFPGFRPAGEVLRPVFLHVPNSFPVSVGTSQLNRPQIHAAVEVLRGFVRVKKVDPAEMIMITGHRPNVAYANRLIRNTPELAGMPPVSTVGTFQGQEKGFVVAVTGLAKGKGSGFISDENRLNVMMTRHTSALLVVGDKLVTDKLEGDEEFMKKAMEKARKGKGVAGKDDDPTFSKSGKLREFLLDFQVHGRFIQLPKSEQSARQEDLALAVLEHAAVEADEEKKEDVGEERVAEGPVGEEHVAEEHVEEEQAVQEVPVEEETEERKREKEEQERIMDHLFHMSKSVVSWADMVAEEEEEDVDEY